MIQKMDDINSNKNIEEILSLNIDDCGVQLCLASLTSEDIADIQRVQITVPVAEEFRNIVKKRLAIIRKDIANEDLILKEYDAQAKLDNHEIEYINLAENNSETLRNQITGLANIESLIVFTEEAEFVSSLRFYVIVIRPEDGEPVFFFRAYTPKKELNRSALFAIVLHKGEYDRFDDNLFLFDQYIDCLIQGDNLFIFNKDKFQKIFRFYELLIAGAKQTLKVIKKQIPIDDFDSFELACEGHLQKLSKLKNIASKPYLKSVTIDDLKKVIQKYKLPIQMVGKGKDEKIQFDASDKWAILRLLDDDYLESVMTGNSYEVNSKRSIKS